jgi:membrane protein YdbS with pleckstrin-like domain
MRHLALLIALIGMISIALLLLLSSAGDLITYAFPGALFGILAFAILFLVLAVCTARILHRFVSRR